MHRFCLHHRGALSAFLSSSAWDLVFCAMCMSVSMRLESVSGNIAACSCRSVHGCQDVVSMSLMLI
jgi:hypothetical protein